MKRKPHHQAAVIWQPRLNKDTFGDFYERVKNFKNKAQHEPLEDSKLAPIERRNEVLEKLEEFILSDDEEHETRPRALKTK